MAFFQIQVLFPDLQNDTEIFFLLHFSHTFNIDKIQGL